MEFAISVVLFALGAIAVLFVAAITVLDMVARLEYIQRKFPGLVEKAQRRGWHTLLFLFAIALLGGNLYELVQHEIPTPPALIIKIGSPPPPVVSEQNQPPKANLRGQTPSGPSSSKGQDVEKLISELTRLANQGTAAQDTFLAHNDTEELKGLRIRWIADTTRFLEARLGESYALQFNNAHGSAMMGCPEGHRVDGCGYWQDIEGKKDSLMAIISDIRRH